MAQRTTDCISPTGMPARFAAHVQQDACSMLAEEYEGISGHLGLVTGHPVEGVTDLVR